MVDGFRELGEEISSKHFSGARLASTANRVEFLPVNWHDKLHGEDTGTDSRIQPLTLRLKSLHLKILLTFYQVHSKNEEFRE